MLSLWKGRPWRGWPFSLVDPGSWALQRHPRPALRSQPRHPHRPESKPAHHRDLRTPLPNYHPARHLGPPSGLRRRPCPGRAVPVQAVAGSPDPVPPCPQLPAAQLLDDCRVINYGGTILCPESLRAQVCLRVRSTSGTYLAAITNTRLEVSRVWKRQKLVGRGSLPL